MEETVSFDKYYANGKVRVSRYDNGDIRVTDLSDSVITDDIYHANTIPKNNSSIRQKFVRVMAIIMYTGLGVGFISIATLALAVFFFEKTQSNAIVPDSIKIALLGLFIGMGASIFTLIPTTNDK